MTDAGPMLRVIPFTMNTGALNMGIDAALLAGDPPPTLRLYGWNPPTVSLGHFQRAVDPTPYAELGCDVVRRMTGGGAVVHHHELTYSLIVRDDHPGLAGLDTAESYHRIHAPIVAMLRTFGVDAQPRTAGAPESRQDEVLCFARTAAIDLVANGEKLVGSAQRRTRGLILQHGSLVVAPNPIQPVGTSLASLLENPPLASELALALTREFGRSAFGPARSGVLTESELALARTLSVDFGLARARGVPS